MNSDDDYRSAECGALAPTPIASVRRLMSGYLACWHTPCLLSKFRPPDIAYDENVRFGGWSRARDDCGDGAALGP